MPRELQRDSNRASLLRSPRIVVVSGMQGTGVSTITEFLQRHAPSLNVVDGGSRWTDIVEACTPGFEKVLAVTTHDIVSITSTYALVKMVRDRFPVSAIEVLVNCSEARDALKTYERIQLAATHFLQETVGYAGAIPYDGPASGEDQIGTMIGEGAVFAIQDVAMRLDEELSAGNGRPATRAAERRIIQ